MAADTSASGLYASYRQVLDGFVSDLDVMLSDLCTQNASDDGKDAEFQDNASPDGSQAVPSPSSGRKRLYEDLIGVTMGVDDPEEEEDTMLPAAPDRPQGEDSYEAPSISQLYYNFDSLKRDGTEELTTVERLQASSRMWFYPTLSRRDALHMLKHKDIGVFMVRNSSKVGNFALSMRQPPPHPYVQHYLIQKTEKGLQVQGAEHFFDSLEELIAHYTDYISGGMPTNLILPQSVASVTNRHELRRVVEKEEAFLTLLEASSTKPHTLDEDQNAMLQVGLDTFPLDNTRVVAPKAAFRQSTDFLTLMQTHIDPTPVLPPTISSSPLERNNLPPSIPPKMRQTMRYRSFTTSASTSQLPGGLLIDLSSSTEAPSALPPPLPPKTRRISDSQPKAPEYHDESGRRKSDQLPPPVPMSDERPNLRQPPPIPKRDRWPAQPVPISARNTAETSFSINNIKRESPVQRSRSFSHASTSSDDCTAIHTPSSMPQDTEGYLMPKELMEIVENKGGKEPLRKSEPQDEKHAYADPDKVLQGTASSNSEAVKGKTLQQKTVAKEKPIDNEPAGAFTAQTLANRGKSTSSTRVRTTEWIKHRAANFSVVSRFSRTASQRLSIYLVKNAFNKSTSFGQMVETFVSAEQAKTHDDPLKLASEVREFMTGLKNHILVPGQKELIDILSKSSDCGSLQEVNLRAILETAMCKVVLKPLKPTIYKSFIDKYTRDGSLNLLKQKMKAAKQMTLEQLGIRDRLIPPQGPSLSQIGQHLVKMQKASSPIHKLEHLLRAVRCIYSSVKDAQSELDNQQLVLGADDFLPMVIYVLCQLEVWKIEVETEYMWAMLEPSLMAGEGGYYLTSITGAVHVIKQLPLPDQPDGPVGAAQASSSNASEAAAVRVGSGGLYWPELDGQTAEGERLPCIADMQGLMRVHFGGDQNGTTSFFRTLPIPVDMNVSDTCAVIATKFGVTNPEKYGLYKVEGDTATLLDDDVFPQFIKAEWLTGDNEYGQKHPTVTQRYFSYRRRP